MWIVQLEKRILKTFFILLGILILLAASLHLYIANNAESLIEDLVRSKSGNKIKLDLKRIRFNYFSNKIVLENATFYSNDSIDNEITYRISIEKINLQVKGL